ncbi:MAG: DUF4386 family protein, partial [Gemmatimonadales bacterium]
MDRFQRNAGTAGLAAGVLLIVLMGLFFTLGLRPEEFGDPTKALQITRDKGTQVAGIAVVGGITTALGILLAAGLAARLRDLAPTRAAAQFYYAVVGLSALALDGTIRWIGATVLATMSDQAAAGPAYVALNAVGAGISGFGNAFTGASLIVVGWAILSTRALPTVLGWVGVLAGVVTAATAVVPPGPLFLLSFVLTIVWLLWAGSALRRP